MILSADPPAVIAPGAIVKPADVVVIIVDTHSEVLASSDTPLLLIKARKTEDALLRQAISLTSTLTVERPATGDDEQIVRWTYVPRLQRQLCFTSITGQFSCAAAEVEDLAEKASGEASLNPKSDQTTPSSNPAAESVRIAMSASLLKRSDAVFDDDRRLKLVPLLHAAGVSVRRSPLSAGAVSR